MHSPTPMQPHSGMPPFPAPGMPMPGTVKTARVLLFTIGGLNAITGLFLLVAGAAAPAHTHGDEDGSALSPWILLAIGALSVALAAAAVVLAARFRSGGDGVRAGAIAIGALVAANALINLVSGSGGMAGPGIALGSIVVANCLRRDAAAYFNRPRG
ncbi:hypothetical protein [Streptomyces sp. NPDC059009]|uniref:hypothetical protein n=1 Tax=Streptomyces sp. NPDC059009 TaxID=3346694 RepID=UPI0036B642EF